MDIESPVRILGGDRGLYFLMLARLEEMSIIPNMKSISVAIEKKDYNVVKANVHSLKGACGYVGASRLHYACYFI